MSVWTKMRLWVLQESQNRKCVKGLPIPYHWKSAEEQTTKAKEKLDLNFVAPRDEVGFKLHMNK